MQRRRLGVARRIAGAKPSDSPLGPAERGSEEAPILHRIYILCVAGWHKFPERFLRPEPKGPMGKRSA